MLIAHTQNHRDLITQGSNASQTFGMGRIVIRGMNSETTGKLGSFLQAFVKVIHMVLRTALTSCSAGFAIELFRRNARPRKNNTIPNFRAAGGRY